VKTVLTYDGTFDGFLSCVFYAYEYKLLSAQIATQASTFNNFFDELIHVPSEESKANRVWMGLGKYASTEGKNAVFKAFLSELSTIEDSLFYYIKLVFEQKNKSSKLIKNYSDPHILKIAKIVKKIGREKHRMDAFVRFRLTKDDLYFATISPDFNVLPLNAKHFKNRYADQKWMIYDLRRKYGIYYDLNTISTVTLEIDSRIHSTNRAELFFTESELQFQELWQNYFKSTNIESRKNMKLHVQHVPKRYWKYLSEKSPV